VIVGQTGLEMKQSIVPGSRVRVSATYHWARSAIGTVGRKSREVGSLNGPLLFRWVEFDTPQVDADGDGPYSGAEIDVRFLEAIGAS
jgi:hypothetical protein